MPASAADSAIFGSLFGQSDMARLFADESLATRWLEVEGALARAEAKVGVIPEEAANAITDAAKRVHLDFDRLAAGTARIGYPIVTLVQMLEEECGEHARWVHWGATTQDIMDTATVLQIADAHDLLMRQLHDVGDAIADLVRSHRCTLMAARTHGQHAVPTTFGYKAAVWLGELIRHEERLAGCRRHLGAQLGGAAGTLASLGANGEDVRRVFADQLGLPLAPIPWHTARDGFVEFTLVLGMISGTLGRVAHEIATLARTEIHEVDESSIDGWGASSTMPQKRNPVLSETIRALAQLTTAEAGAAFGWLQQEDDRGMGTWHPEWDVLPRTCIYTSAGLSHASTLLRGMRVDDERMRANILATAGGINAEAVMMRLAESLGRTRAYSVVYEASRKAEAEGVPLRSALLARRDVTSLLSEQEVDSLLEPAEYVGMAEEFAARVLAWWQAGRGGTGPRPEPSTA